VLVTSSFTGWNNYMMNLGKMMGDAEAMKRFGNTVVIWDLHTRTPKKILDVPGHPSKFAVRGAPVRITASPPPH
jgi:selenium-binding protein 1